MWLMEIKESITRTRNCH